MLNKRSTAKTKFSQLSRAVVSVTGVIVLAKALGFVKQMVIASRFGTTIETDLVNLSQGFIGDIQYVLVQVLLTSFTSIYIHTLENDETEAKRFVADTLKVFSVIAACVSVCVVITAPVIARVIAPSYTQELSGRLSGYIRMFSPLLVFFVWTAVSQSLLNAHKRFVPGELIGANKSIVLIVLVLLFEKYYGIRTLVFGFFIYTTLDVVFLGSLAFRYGGRSSGNPINNAAVRRLLRMTGPLFLSYAMVYINQQVDKILSSGLPAGSVTALGYGATLANLVGTFIVSFCSILFTYITAHISKNEHRSAAEWAIHSATVLVLAFLPISILTFFCAKEIVTVVFGRGAFSDKSIQAASAALMGYSFSFVPLVFRELFSRFQYGYQDSRAPMVNSIIGIVGNIILSIVLCPYFGVLGIAFASSVSVLICGLLNAVTARRHNQDLRFYALLRKIPILLLGVCVCALTAKWSLLFLKSSSPLLRIVVTTICSGGSYLVTVSPVLYQLIRKRRAI